MIPLLLLDRHFVVLYCYFFRWDELILIHAVSATYRVHDIKTLSELIVLLYYYVPGVLIITLQLIIIGIYLAIVLALIRPNYYFIISYPFPLSLVH